MEICCNSVILFASVPLYAYTDILVQ